MAIIEQPAPVRLLPWLTRYPLFGGYRSNAFGEAIGGGELSGGFVRTDSHAVNSQISVTTD